MSTMLRVNALAQLTLVVALLVACSDSEQAGGSLGLGVNVQLAWQAARTTSGHKLHVGQHRVRCAACHELVSDQVGKASPTRCRACHERESSLHHAERQAEQRFGKGVFADCTSCHTFAVAGQSTREQGLANLEPSRSDCARCHAVRQGQTPAVVVHGSSQCLNCHRPHEDAKPEPGSCAKCHGNISTSHASADRSPLKVCTTCHQHQHAPAADALATCRSCHQKEPPLVPASALFADGHGACVGCHRPHEFEKNAAVPCRSCHAELAVLGAERVPAHGKCTSCHEPHAVRNTPAHACAKCHSEVHPNHPAPNAAGGCVGCHDPHPPARQTKEAARACSSCHQSAHADKEFHAGLACTQCHKPHAFTLAKAEHTLCAGCHAGEVSRASASAGHHQCESCHRGLPHRPATLLTSCDTCHQSQQQKVRPGHEKCASCHEPHSGAQAAACRSCHQKEAQSAPSGHAACVNCHQPHSGAASWTACAGCHTGEAQSKHGQISGGCANCHRPHGPSGKPSPPACNQCHQPASLPGLHQVAKHQDCARCHSAHGATSGPTREACLACHTERKSHFPDAARCTSCHLFDARPQP